MLHADQLINSCCMLSGVVSADVKLYNAQTNTWSKTASMNAPRSWFAATVIGDKIYVAGGQGRSRFLDSAEVFHTKEEVWCPIQSMNCVRFSSSGVTLDGQFWVVAGEYMRSANEDRPRRASAEVYNPRTDSWRTVEDMWLDCDKVGFISACPKCLEKRFLFIDSLNTVPQNLILQWFSCFCSVGARTQHCHGRKAYRHSLQQGDGL